MTDEKKETKQKENIDHDLLFDADAPYVIKTRFKVGSTEKVTHTLKPYNPGHIDLFERRANNTVVINNRSEVNTDSTTKDRALVYFYDLLVESADKYTGKDWKKKVPLMQKIAVAKAILENFILTEEEVRSKFGPQYIEETCEHNVVYMISRNNNMFYLTIHILHEPDEGQITEYRRIKTSSETKAKKNKVIITPQLTSRRYCNLYDGLVVEAKEYKNNETEKIPAFHKVEVVHELFGLLEENLESIEGN